MYYDLKNNELVEIKDNSKSLLFLYNTVIGRILLKILTTKIIANISRIYMNSRISKIRIKKFVKKNNINLKDYEEKKYKSFNDFFIRKIKEDKRKISDGFISVCDSKLLVYKIDKNKSFKIKNSIYTIEELIRDDYKKYNYEYALIFRLCAYDYHHYVYPDNGKVISSKYINGILHTVQPIALKKEKVFLENSRNITFLECENLGNVCYIEVGALLIGKIVNEEKKEFKKGEEKGHFEFGGSTVILLIEKNKLKINKKILENSNNDIETIVKLGERLD